MFNTNILRIKELSIVENTYLPMDEEANIQPNTLYELIGKTVNKLMIYRSIRKPVWT